MGNISNPNTFSAGATIIASEHNSNYDTIYTEFNGNISNDNIKTSAGIVGSKLDLSIPGAIGGTTPAAGSFSTLIVGTTHEGDVIYDNGTSLVRLEPGTSGHLLMTAGSSAAVAWTAPPTGLSAWGRVTWSGGTPTLADSYNVRAISDAAVGDLWIFWDTEYPSGKYGIVATAGTDDKYCSVASIGVSNASINIYDASEAGLADPSTMSFMVVGTD